ncbi:MAG: adenylosuccinate synthase [Alphaproteobacteria bacterium]
MPSLVIVGAQWGDEGKGKVVDLFAAHADVVVRFQGGNNAGHTLVVGTERTIVHLMPAGVLHEQATCVIGNGVVIDPAVLCGEIDDLRGRGYLADPSRLKIDERAHLILPVHRAIDVASEERAGEGRIGTTGRGIGPCYEDKMARRGLRVVDLLDPEWFRRRLDALLAVRNPALERLGRPPADADAICREILGFGERLAPHVTDTSVFLADQLERGRRILFEGAHGSMLDIDHGTYPFVTSSNVVTGAVGTGAGVAPKHVSRVLGISKAYTTRVGGGPFPTELDDEVGAKLREVGVEFGSTTGRPRRCGWFDAVVVRQAARLSGMSGIALTKLDVLSGLPKLRIAVAYDCDGRRFDRVPAGMRDLEAAKPVYEELDGWDEDIGHVRRFDELPAAARRYIARIEELTSTPVTLISVGAEREETILLRDPFLV